VASWIVSGGGSCRGVDRVGGWIVSGGGSCRGVDRARGAGPRLTRIELREGESVIQPNNETEGT